LAFFGGFGVETITPKIPMPLAGFGPDRVGRQVLDDLKIRAVYVSDGSAQLVLVSVDSLYVSRSFCTKLEQWLEETHSIPAANLFVAATHTHCAPSLLDREFAGVSIEAEYSQFVLKKAKLAIAQSIDAKFEAELEYTKAPSQISINRRALRLDRISMRRLKIHRSMINRPNPRGPVDATVRAVWIRARSASDTDIALVSAGCHPSILRGDTYSADFPGRIEFELRSRVNRPTDVVFVQGFSGNSRARILDSAPFAVWPMGRAYDWIFDRSRFRDNSTVDDIKWVAGAIATAIANAPRSPCDNVRLDAKVTEVKLPLESGDSDGAGNDFVPFLIRTWALSENMRVLGLEGEIFSEYGNWLEDRDTATGSTTVPVSCVGGIAGYIPTAATISEGGYEIDRSRTIFDLPRRFSPTIERIIKNEIRAHLGHSS
jgi:hypothetical protein